MIDNRLDTIINGVSALNSSISGKQDALVSGTNIKTINNESILGSGDLVIQSGGGSSEITSWADVKSVVATGRANEVFTVGVDQFQCNHTTHGAITWDIIGFNHDLAVDENNNLIYQNAPEFRPYITELTGDGNTTTFKIYDRPKTVDRVAVNGVDLTSGYTYSETTHILTFNTAPSNNAKVVVYYAIRQMPTITLLQHYPIPTVARGSGDNWSGSSFRTTLNSNESGGYLNGLDPDLKNILVYARKSTVDGSTTLTDLYDKVYVPSEYEVYAASPDKNQTYYEYFYKLSSNNAPSTGMDTAREKKLNSTSSGYIKWWLRDRASTVGKLKYVDGYSVAGGTIYNESVSSTSTSIYLCPLIVIGG